MVTFTDLSLDSIDEIKTIFNRFINKDETKLENWILTFSSKLFFKINSNQESIQIKNILKILFYSKLWFEFQEPILNPEDFKEKLEKEVSNLNSELNNNFKLEELNKIIISKICMNYNLRYFKRNSDLENNSHNNYFN